MEMQKKTAGRRKIRIEKIENKLSRQVTFSKRRNGLFKKANQLATLSGSQIALIIFSETGKPSAFGPQSVIDRFLRESDRSTFDDDAEMLLWRNRIETMGFNQLRLYADHLRNLKDLVASKAASMAENCSSGNESGRVDSPANFVRDDELTASFFDWDEVDKSQESLLFGEERMVEEDQFDDSFLDLQWEDGDSDLLASL